MSRIEVEILVCGRRMYSRTPAPSTTPLNHSDARAHPIRERSVYAGGGIGFGYFEFPFSIVKVRENQALDAWVATCSVG